MPFPPEVYLLGAQKAGTTSLAFWLDQHPDLCLSEPKEPDFFTLNHERGLKWYSSVFKGAENRIFVDASSSYSMAPIETYASAHNPLRGVPRRIHAVNPAAKFIYVLREPVERTYSSYWHSVRAGEEKHSFGDVLQANSLYVRTSDYFHQLNEYLEYFSLDAFLFIPFEDLKADPQGVARRCFEFLSIAQPDFEVTVGTPKNQSYTFNSLGRAVQRLLPSKTAIKVASDIVKTVIPQRYHQRIGALVTQRIPPIADTERTYLAHYFSERNLALQELTGVDVSPWQQRH